MNDSSTSVPTFGRFAAWSLFAILMLGQFAGTPAQAAIRIVGSDLLPSELILTLQDTGRLLQLPVEVNLLGTRPALAALEADEADLALVAATDAYIGRLEPFPRFVFAYLVVIVAVAEENPLRQLSLGQLSTLLSAEGGGTLRRWGDLGLEDPWAPRALSILAPSPRQSLVLPLAASQLLRTPNLRPNIILMDELPALQLRLEADRTALALLPVNPSSQTRFRPVFIAEQADGVAFGPSLQNIHTGDYPLRMPFLAVSSPTAQARLRPFLEFLLGSETAQILEAGQLHPLPTGVRQLLLENLPAAP